MGSDPQSYLQHMHDTYRLGGRTEREWQDRERELLAANTAIREELRGVQDSLIREIRARTEKPDFGTYIDLKYGIVGTILWAVQNGEITRSRACEALAEVAHGMVPRLPEVPDAIPEDVRPLDIWRELQSAKEQARKAQADLALISGIESLYANICKETSANFEFRVVEWIKTRLGESHLQGPERAMRLLEEAIELAQAEGIAQDMVSRQAEHVYARPKGEPVQEAAGVAVCLLGWCGSNGVMLYDIAKAEIERIEAKPLDQIRCSLLRKSDSDLVTVVTK